MVGQWCCGHGQQRAWSEGWIAGQKDGEQALTHLDIYSRNRTSFTALQYFRTKKI